ncbi:FHA domain-containing protein, partial [Candidatus Sumerlaeota bacterium]|nr:FHA domain-containing protein [Candidatus Sumerlaeota bacterium]
MTEIIVKLGDNVVHKYFFDKDILNIGRARDNDIVIENLAVSRNHARIRRVEGKYILTDLNSANGTFVNGVRITKTEIMHNDVITIGKHNL